MPGHARTRRDDEPARMSGQGRIRFRDLDRDAVKVIRRLVRHGHVAYLVGGCVRDLLVGVPPKDFDIATDATPRQIKRLFRNSRIIGRRFRLVHVTFNEKVLDVSTFRAPVDVPHDEADLLIRHDNVFGDAAGDARRRDFTINGLFYDVDAEEVIDYVGGLEDLDRATIETIGDPWVRFREDPVRMLRAIKFAGRLSFRLADDVYQAIIDCAEEIRKAAPPRLLEEVVRLMNRGGAHDSIRLLYKTGLLAILFPEVAARIDNPPTAEGGDVFWESLSAVDRLVRRREDPTPAVLLACLFGILVEEDLEAIETGADNRACDLPHKIEQRIRPVAGRLVVSRRDTYRIQQVLLAQERFLSRGPAKRRRRLSDGHFMARDYFRDAFAFFRVRCRATRRNKDVVIGWHQKVDEARSQRENVRARA